MKPFKALYLFPSAAVLGAVLFSGCYTQLALNTDDSEGIPDSDAIEVVQPAPVGVIVEPIYVPVQPPPVRLPVATTSGSQPQAPPQPSIREIGSQRTGSASSQGNSGSSGRTNGSTRGGR